MILDHLGESGPRAGAEQPPVEISGDQPAGYGADEQPLLGCTVLLVDDSPVNVRVARTMLERWAAEVEVARNGLEAVEAISARPFDAVLMDCQMPEMDGFEATSAIRRSEKGPDRHQIIVAMTASAMEGDRELCIRSGMDDYISKPVRPADLLTVLGHWIDDRGPATAPVVKTVQPKGAVLDIQKLLTTCGHRDSS